MFTVETAVLAFPGASFTDEDFYSHGIEVDRVLKVPQLFQCKPPPSIGSSHLWDVFKTTSLLCASSPLFGTIMVSTIS